MAEIMYRAIKYIRLSDSDGKQGESDSVTNQRRLIDEYIKKNPDIEDVGEKIDDGYTGIIFDRPAFKEMMDLIKEGKVNCCITKDLSRLGREYIETGRHLREIFPMLGCRFIAINDNIDTLTDKGDDLNISLKTITNDSYSRDISVKTRSALNIKRENGEHVSAFAVYGYKKAENNRNQLIIDDYSASIVREIFNMKIDGLSNIYIARTLNERGVLSPVRYKKEQGLPYAKKGYGDKDEAKWSVSTLLRILKDETYTGTLVQGMFSTPNYKLKNIITKPMQEWKRFENAHEAIIEKYKFDLTQHVMKLDTRTPPNVDKVHTFSGILICGSCGGRMTHKAVPYKGVKYRYFHCPTTKKRGCNDAVLLKVDELTEIVLKYIRTHFINLASLDRILHKVDADKIAREHANILTAQLSEKEQRLMQIRTAQASLVEDKYKSIISEAEYRSLKAQLIVDADIMVKNIEKLKKDIDDVLLCNNERLAWVEHYRQFSNINELDRKTVINFIQYIKVISKTELEVFFNFEPEYDVASSIVKVGGFDERG